MVLSWKIRFAVLCLVWGCSFLFIKLGDEAFEPLHVTFGRLFFGTAVLLGVLAVKRERLPQGLRTWGHLAVAAFFLNSLPFSLFAFAEERIPSTLAGICNATTPLFGMVLSWAALRDDRPTARRVAGLALGFGGVLVVLGVWNGTAGHDPAGTAMALGAGASYAVGWLHVRRTLAGRPHSDASMTAGQLLAGTAELAVAVALFTSPPRHGLPLGPLLAVFALGALGTGLAFLIQYGLVAEVGPTTAQLVTYFVPVIATVAGVVALHERIGWNTPVGAAVVLAGAALSRSGPGAGTREAARTKGPGAGSEPGAGAAGPRAGRAAAVVAPGGGSGRARDGELDEPVRPGRAPRSPAGELR